MPAEIQEIWQICVLVVKLLDEQSKKKKRLDIPEKFKLLLVEFKEILLDELPRKRHSTLDLFGVRS